MICSQAGCGSENVRLYRRYLGGQTLLCQPCHDRLVATTSMSLTLIERREHDVQPLIERRHIAKPRWLANLTARDETRRSA